MLENTTLEKYDAQGIHKVYDRWPEIAEDSYRSKFEQIHFDDVSHIVFAGMGGSGALGDIFSAILTKTKTHVCLVKGYLLPKTVDSETLVVTTSISGNTKETLSVLNSAKEIGAKTIAFASGGKMQELCKKNSIEFRLIPEYHSPSASFPSFLYSMLKVLEPILPINNENICESINQSKKLRNEISSSNLTFTNPSLNLAMWIDNIPLIYYPWGLQAAAIRFKNSLQENAKSHAITEDVIEACHNGIVSWEKPSVVKPILLQGKDDYFKTKERWHILKEYLQTKNIDYREVISIEGGILSKLINLIYLLDYTTIFRAVLSKIDPTPIDSINFIKKRL